MLEDKGTVANPGRFASDYQEWTDWDTVVGHLPFVLLPTISMRASPGRTTHAQDILFRVAEREYSFPLVPRLPSHFEDTISKQITSPAAGLALSG